MDLSCRHRCMSTTAVSSKEEMDDQAPETAFLWSLLRIMEEISWIEWNMFLWGRSCERRRIIWYCRLDADPAASLHVSELFPGSFSLTSLFSWYFSHFFSPLWFPERCCCVQEGFVFLSWAMGRQRTLYFSVLTQTKCRHLKQVTSRSTHVTLLLFSKHFAGIFV